MPGYQGFALYLAAMMLLWMIKKRGVIEAAAAVSFLIAYLAFTNRWLAVAALFVPLLGIYLRKSTLAPGKLPVFMVLSVYYWLVLCALGLHFQSW